MTALRAQLDEAKDLQDLAADASADSLAKLAVDGLTKVCESVLYVWRDSSGGTTAKTTEPCSGQIRLNVGCHPLPNLLSSHGQKDQCNMIAIISRITNTAPGAATASAGSRV
jgi:hypothetical protein